MLEVGENNSNKEKNVNNINDSNVKLMENNNNKSINLNSTTNPKILK
jgi:hypothetical protein